MASDLTLCLWRKHNCINLHQQYKIETSVLSIYSGSFKYPFCWIGQNNFLWQTKILTVKDKEKHVLSVIS